MVGKTIVITNPRVGLISKTRSFSRSGGYIGRELSAGYGQRQRYFAELTPQEKRETVKQEYSNLQTPQEKTRFLRDVINTQVEAKQTISGLTKEQLQEAGYTSFETSRQTGQLYAKNVEGTVIPIQLESAPQTQQAVQIGKDIFPVQKETVGQRQMGFILTPTRKAKELQHQQIFEQTMASRGLQKSQVIQKKQDIFKGGSYFAPYKDVFFPTGKEGEYAQPIITKGGRWAVMPSEPSYDKYVSQARKQEIYSALRGTDILPKGKYKSLEEYGAKEAKIPTFFKSGKKGRAFAKGRYLYGTYEPEVEKGVGLLTLPVTGAAGATLKALEDVGVTREKLDVKGKSMFYGGLSSNTPNKPNNKSYEKTRTNIATNFIQSHITKGYDNKYINFSKNVGNRALGKVGGILFGSSSQILGIVEGFQKKPVRTTAEFYAIGKITKPLGLIWSGVGFSGLSALTAPKGEKAYAAAGTAGLFGIAGFASKESPFKSEEIEVMSSQKVRVPEYERTIIKSRKAFTEPSKKALISTESLSAFKEKVSSYSYNKRIKVKTFGLDIGTRSIPLFSKYRGKLSFGLPKIEGKIKPSELLKETQQPLTSLGGKTLGSIVEYSKEDLARIENVIQAGRILQKETGLPVKSFVAKIEGLKNPKKATSIVENIVSEKKGVFFGSLTTQQLPSKGGIELPAEMLGYEIGIETPKARVTKGFKTQKPGDIDLMFPSLTVKEIKPVIKQMTRELQLSGEKVRISPTGRGTIIEFMPEKGQIQGNKFLEAKSGIDQESLGLSDEAPVGFLGFEFANIKKGQIGRTVPFGKARAITAGEQFLRKGASITTVRPITRNIETPEAFREAGVLGKDRRSVKDISGFLQSGQGLVYIRESTKIRNINPLRRFMTGKAKSALSKYSETFNEKQISEISKYLKEKIGDTKIELKTQKQLSQERELTSRKYNVAKFISSQKLLDNEFSKKIPKYLYHGTISPNIKGIMKEGLKPFDVGWKDKGVFFTSSPKEASYWGQIKADRANLPYKSVTIFRIKTTPKLMKEVDAYTEQETIFTRKIKPSELEILNKKSVFSEFKSPSRSDFKSKYGFKSPFKSPSKSSYKSEFKSPSRYGYKSTYGSPSRSTYSYKSEFKSPSRSDFKSKYGFKSPFKSPSKSSYKSEFKSPSRYGYKSSYGSPSRSAYSYKSPSAYNSPSIYGFKSPSPSTYKYEEPLYRPPYYPPKYKELKLEIRKPKSRKQRKRRFMFPTLTPKELWKGWTKQTTKRALRGIIYQ